MTWTLLLVTSQQERFVVEALRENGVEAYVPMQVTQAQYARRKATRTRPLIPGYVFANLADDHAIFLAISLRPVRAIMCREGRPRAIPLNMIGALILFESCHEWDETWVDPPPPKVKGKRYTRRWAPGDEVRVVSGPYENFVGTVLRAKGKNRFDVLMSVFGHTSEVNFQDKHLVKPSDQKRAA